MTRYRVPVTGQLLAERDTWQPVIRFRLVSADGPWLSHPDITICTFEDDDAPPELEGKLVEPVLRRHDDGRIIVLSRQVITP